MELIRDGDGLFRSPPMPNTPVVQVLFGGDEGGPYVGVAKVTIPVGSAMPEHNHGGSDVVVMPIAGSIEISSSGNAVVVGSGDALLIRKDEKVGVKNLGDSPAQFIVSAGPANFLEGIRTWPEPSE